MCHVEGKTIGKGRRPFFFKNQNKLSLNFKSQSECDLASLRQALLRGGVPLKLIGHSYIKCGAVETMHAKYS